MNPFRFFGFILFFVIQIISLFSGGRSRRYGRIYSGMSYLNINGLNGMPYETYSNTGLGAIIRCNVRRRRALKICSNFCKKTRYVITLKNQNITLIFDTKNKTLCCFDNNRKDRSATVVWAEQLDYIPQEKDNIFEQTFDNICLSFSKKANYEGILQVFKDNFDEIHETGNAPAKIKPIEPEDEPLKLHVDKMVDINTATAEQLSTLPGINIVLAKRIVKYRDLKGEITSKEELFNEFNIKEHFQKELVKLIIFSRHEKLIKSYDRINKNILSESAQQKKNKNNNDKNDGGERIIDF